MRPPWGHDLIIHVFIANWNNSLTQGEQLPIFSALLNEAKVIINFAHQPFRWSNEARGKAAVHCVIVGFSLQDEPSKRIFLYDDVNSGPHETTVAHINPKLTADASTLVSKQQRQISGGPGMGCGSKPSDGGFLILNESEKKELITRFPAAEPFVRQYVGSEEFLNRRQRWCLWLEDASPALLRSIAPIYERVKSVSEFRKASSAVPTQKAATTPHRFFFVNQSKEDYILFPEVSSERRVYVPVGLMSKTIISSNKNYLIPSASLYIFGLLQSMMHMSWMRQTAGRLESRYQYSATMVYNTFALPDSPSDAQKRKVEEAARAILDARAAFPDSSLADLYDPLTMPPALVKAHQKLDTAVDAAYGKRTFNNDAERVAYLFELYQKYTSILPSDVLTKKASKKKT
jgi:hypothetical protein